MNCAQIIKPCLIVHSFCVRVNLEETCANFSLSIEPGTFCCEENLCYVQTINCVQWLTKDQLMALSHQKRKKLDARLKHNLSHRIKNHILWTAFSAPPHARSYKGSCFRDGCKLRGNQLIGHVTVRSHSPAALRRLGEAKGAAGAQLLQRPVRAAG